MPKSRSSPRSGFRRLMLPLLARASRRFVAEDYDQVSASLAFTTLLSLVPMVALMLAIASAFPSFAEYVTHVERLLETHLLPKGSAGLISGKIMQFSRRAAEVSWLGVVVLVVTVFLMLNTIERAFNHVWRVTESRAIWERLLLYAVVVVVWPALIGGLLAGVSYAVTTSLGLIGEMPWLRAAMLKLLSLGVLAVFLAFLYHAVPKAPVGWREAGIAGVSAALGFVLLQKAFELYLSYFPSYKAIYGAFAVVPIFLLWVYLSWAVVLFGALVAAILPEFERGGAAGRRRSAR